MRKVFITGASGLLGRALVREFQAKSGIEVLATAFNRVGAGLIKIDLLDIG